MMKKPSRATRGRIRQLIAAELRQRIAQQHPGYLESEPPEVQEAWTIYVFEIAHQISPERS